MKFKKLGMRGFSHHFVLALIVVSIAIVGTYLVVASHAETPNGQFYRLYNGRNHFYTASQAEETSAVQNSGYRLEQTYTTYFENGTPSQSLYRLYNTTTGDHLYTANSGEIQSAVAIGYAYEGVALHFYPSTDPVPAGYCRDSWYRLFNGTDHFYTPNAKEASTAQAGGYTLESSNAFTTDRTCEAVSSPVTNPIPSPTVTITTPANQSKVSGTIAVSALTSDADTTAHASVQLTIDGIITKLPNGASTSPYSYAWNTTTVPDGQHALRYIVTYTDGLRSASTATAQVNVTVSNGPGEQLSFPPQRRPAQYVHACLFQTKTIYVTQGLPKCLGNDAWKYDFQSTAPGLTYNVPCKVNSTLTRYVYIAQGATCPGGTTALRVPVSTPGTTKSTD